MDIYHHRSITLFSGPHLLGMLFTLAGTFSLISPYLIEDTSANRSLYIGLGGIGFGLAILSIYGGTLINFKGKKIKEYHAVLGYKFGEWKDLPDITSVRLIAHSYEDTNISNGISPTLSGEVTDYLGVLCNQEEEPVVSLLFTREKKAIAEINKIADQLGITPDFLLAD